MCASALFLDLDLAPFAPALGQFALKFIPVQLRDSRSVDCGAQLQEACAEGCARFDMLAGAGKALGCGGCWFGTRHVVLLQSRLTAPGARYQDA